MTRDVITSPILNPILSATFINKLDDRAEHTFHMASCDTSLVSVADGIEGFSVIQRDFDSLERQEDNEV